jgi:hypothetical protein
MAGLETVVRPVVFPVIRPTPKQSAPQKDDPNQGKAVITGSSGKIIDLPYSYSISSTQSKSVELQRTVDDYRVYQKDDDGNINRDNFIDIAIARKIQLQDGEDITDVWYQAPEEEDNIDQINSGRVIRYKGPGAAG